MKSTITTINPEQAVEMMAKSKEAGGLNRLTKAKVAKLLLHLLHDLSSGSSFGS
jgi:hypothetical protein